MKTRKEAEKLLNSMLIPNKDSEKCINANDKLSQKDKEALYNIIINFENQGKNYQYNNALGQVVSIMSNYASQITNTNKGKIPINPETMPFLIKQVLFYFAVMGKLCKLKNMENPIALIEYIHTYGVNLSHNFFSNRIPMTPTEYIAKETYVQPKHIIKYKGQKNGDLAIAIKNLVYQAGKYNYFVDIFGGSGAATTAVNRKKNSRYVYNELNEMMYDMFCVLSDKKLHEKLCVKMNALQEYLRGSGEWIDPEILDDAINKYNNKIKKIYNIVEVDTTTDSSEEVEGVVNYNDIINFMNELKKDINGYPDDKFKCDDETYTREELIEILFSDDDLFMSYNTNFSLIKTILQQNYYMCSMYGLRTTKQTRVFIELLDNYRQNRFYLCYAYFYCIEKGWVHPKDSMHKVMAEIYLWSFTTSGNKGISSINRMLMDSTGSQNPSKDAKNFLDTDFKEEIENLYKHIKGTICKNLDFREVIEEYGKNNRETSSESKRPKEYKALFYSDSPYDSTSDYEDANNNVDCFSPNDMKDLINGLVDSERRFIFSCRATRASKDKKKNEEGNASIKKNVFDVFNEWEKSNNKKFWVLVIGEKSLKTMLKNNDVIEIMITNYEIFPFSDEKSKSKFEVYEFNQFMKCIYPNEK